MGATGNTIKDLSALLSVRHHFTVEAAFVLGFTISEQRGILEGEVSEQFILGQDLDRFAALYSRIECFERPRFDSTLSA